MPVGGAARGLQELDKLEEAGLQWEPVLASERNLGQEPHPPRRSPQVTRDLELVWNTVFAHLHKKCDGLSLLCDVTFKKSSYQGLVVLSTELDITQNVSCPQQTFLEGLIALATSHESPEAHLKFYVADFSILFDDISIVLRKLTFKKS